MSFFDLFSDSNSGNSTTSSTSTQVDNRQDNRVDSRQTNTTTSYNTSTLGNGAMVLGDGSSVSLTDAGAVKDAFNFGTDLASYFGTQGTKTTGRALDSVDSAVASLERGQKQAFNAIDSAQGNAFDFGAQLAKLFGNNINTNASRALDSADGAIDSALKFGSTTSGRAFDLVDSTVSAALKSVGDSNKNAFNTADSMASTFANSLTANANKSTAGLLDTVSSIASGNLDFLKGVLKSNADSTNAVTNLVANAYNDAKGRGAQTDTMLMVAIGGALLVAFFAIKK